jgi:hypothetical protein
MLSRRGGCREYARSQQNADGRPGSRRHESNDRLSIVNAPAQLWKAT